MYRSVVLLAALVIGALFPVARLTALETDAAVVISFDAEALAWTAPVEFAADPDSLDGRYIIPGTGQGDGNAGSMSIHFPRAGDYYVWARIKAPTGTEHALDVELGGARYTWSIGDSAIWHWERFARADGPGGTTSAALSISKAGDYPFKVFRRTGGVSLDAFLITDDLYLAPLDHVRR
jgi:hypothetical protein